LTERQRLCSKGGEAVERLRSTLRWATTVHRCRGSGDVLRALLDVNLRVRSLVHRHSPVGLTPSNGRKDARMNGTPADPARKQARRPPVHCDGAQGQIRLKETFCRPKARAEAPCDEEKTEGAKAPCYLRCSGRRALVDGGERADQGEEESRGQVTRGAAGHEPMQAKGRKGGRDFLRPAVRGRSRSPGLPAPGKSRDQGGVDR
jgi:hypothetical protein